MKLERIFVTPKGHARLPVVAEEKWLLGSALGASLALFALTFLMMRPFDLPFGLGSDAKYVPPPRAFDVDAEMASLLRGEPVQTVDLAANADLAPRQTFAAAKGPPLNLLAQVGPRVEVAARVTHPATPPATANGPVLSDDERLIVAANEERREVRVALLRLQERTTDGTTGVATAILVEPLLRRAEAAATSLDSYGDALLLAEGEAMKQMAFLGFYASRAAALSDIEQAEAILGEA